jgi:uncharacterized SAM-binding protein YcdF (DUF218 family)
VLPGELKPILTALALPPAAPLLLGLAGVLLVLARRVRTGGAIVLLALAGLWLASCHAVATRLADALLPVPAPISAEQLRSVQAIVVVGGGVLAFAPEYGAAQPNAYTLGRLRYGARLARESGKPLGFAGGVGWSAAGTTMAPEARVASAALAEFGASLRWSDSRSRDTAENAAEMRRLLQPDGVRRIALVSDTWHLPRAELEFRRAGFEVVPAPTGFPAAQTRPLLGWLPSSEGLTLTRQVLRERLGLMVAGA